MKADDLFDMATWGELVFDPRLPRLYMTESHLDRKSNEAKSHIVRWDWGDFSVRPLTQGDKDSCPKPSSDGQHLAFLSYRSGSKQVWLLPLNGGEARPLTSIQGGVKAYCWAPDSSGMVVVARIRNGLVTRETPEAALPQDACDSLLEQYYNRDVKHITHQFYKLDGTGFFDRGRDQLLWVGLDGGIRLLTSGFHQYSDPLFSPDGSALYCLKRDYDPEGRHPDVATIQRFSWPCGQVTVLPIKDLIIKALSVSPDHRYLAFHGSDPNHHDYGLTVLYRWDLDNETLQDMSGFLDRAVGDQSVGDLAYLSTARPAWNQGAVVTLLSQEGQVFVTSFGEGVTEKKWRASRVVYDFALRDGMVALAVSDPTHPSGILAGRWDAELEQALWAPTPWGDGEGPLSPNDFWLEQEDGARVHGWCLHPKGVGPFPVVLEIHGGPMAMYGYRYMHEFQCLAVRGYAVVHTNPRGSQGYGAAFCQAIKGNWGDKDYADIMAGLEHALNLWPDLDRRCMGVAGGSYGGFMVNWIVSHSQVFQAAVTMRSVVNRFSAMGSSDMGWLRIAQYGHLPWWEDPAPYWRQSPLKYVSNIHTPLLIEHQEQDYRLPVEQGEQLYSALKYLGRPVELLLYPHESHGMSRIGQPWHRVHRLKAIVRWFDRYLK